MGTIYLRGKTYWIKYFRNGKAFFESSKSRKETDAKKLLRLREGEIAKGRLPGKLFERVCDLLYGPQAGPIMASYYRLSAYLPDKPIEESNQVLGRGYLPMSWNRLYALPSHWRHLALDSKTWRDQISNERYADRFGRMGIERRELHRRLARRWRIGSDLNQKAAVYLKDALDANPLPDCVEDLRFLATSLRAWQPLIDSLVEYHTGLEGYFSSPREVAQVKACFNSAYGKAKEAQQAGALAFPDPIDPVGSDVGAVRKYNDLLVQAIEQMQKGL